MTFLEDFEQLHAQISSKALELRCTTGSALDVGEGIRRSLNKLS